MFTKGVQRISKIKYQTEWGEIAKLRKVTSYIRHKDEFQLKRLVDGGSSASESFISIVEQVFADFPGIYQFQVIISGIS